MINVLLPLSLLIPLATTLGIAIAPRQAERRIATLAIFGAGLVVIQQLCFFVIALDVTLHWQYALPMLHHEFVFDLYSDRIGLIFGGLTALFCLTIVRFSRVYLHREPGFRRFFSMIFLLVSGMLILSFANNLLTFFIGWELIGIASFVLIAFYREQKSSVINALKVFAAYRVGDLGLVFGMMTMHYLATADAFDSLALDATTLPPSALLTFSMVGIVVAAMAKSAQFPFSFWLPRAMEGPTPSSAIFYGALSVHGGIILLIKLQSIWLLMPSIRIFIIVIGALTAILAEGASRTHPSIKGRLAMSSLTQVGLIFAELGFGWHTLALYHTVAHALLRSAQILISPSIITHIMRLNSARIAVPLRGARGIERLLPDRLRATLWVLAFQEHFIEQLLTKSYFCVRNFMSRCNYLQMIVVLAIGGSVLLASAPAQDRAVVVYLAIALLCSVASIVNATWFWPRWASACCSVLITAAVPLHYQAILPRVSFIMISLIVAIAMAGYLLIPAAIRREPIPGLVGLWHDSPRRARWFFISAGLLAGIPPSPLFFLEDIAWSALISQSVPVVFVLGVVHACNGIALFKTAAYLTMGPNLGCWSSGRKVATYQFHPQHIPAEAEHSSCRS